MREDFDGQGRHVIDAAVGLGGVSFMIPAAGSFLRDRDTIDLSHHHDVLTTETDGGLSWSQRQTRKRRDTVNFIVTFVRLKI